MAIYRGTGGSSTTTDETTINAVNQKAAEAATSASNAASSASSAATSASNAGSSATSASTSASTATTAATQASASKDAAALSATNAAASELAAETAQTAAEAAETNAILYGNMANTAAGDATTAKNNAEAAEANAQYWFNQVASAEIDAAASAVAAAESETNAAASETAAASSESNAASSEIAAAASAIAADASANDAASSEANAAASETASAASAASASTSATTATTQATAASTSASAAATSASNASTSESNASSSETNAASSATAASGSATAAASSAAAAATSETNAANSATAAYTSETNAAASATAAAASEAGVAADAATATTKAAEAATSETNAAASATTATTKASEAATSAANAAASETNAEASETAAATSASAASAAKDAALAALDSFDDRYLGVKSSAPTVDNDGNPLVAGSLYFNSTDDAMNVYDGSQWLAAYADLSGALIATSNLSDLTNASAARTNLGLGTAATTASTDYATAAQGALADTALQSIPSEYLTQTEGDALYMDINAVTLPDQTGHSGQFLSTNGTTADWATVDTTQGDTAYGWGDHALEGYLTSIPDNYLLNTGDAITGDLSFGDNDKAIFGAGSDLQIYHDGSKSLIEELGQGDLEIVANNLYMRTGTGEYYMGAVSNAGVFLRYDNATKLTTTSTGIDVTGNIAVSGNVDGRDIAADGTKLDGIEAGAQVNVPTNLGSGTTSTSVNIISSTGSNTSVPAATTSSAGALTAADKTKLDGIATNANNYSHPTYAGDDFSIDTGALSGATVISDLDFNVTTDTLGHVTDANATYSTRNLTASDIGAQPAGSYLTTSTGFGGDVSGTYNAIVVANDSHTHDGRYYTESESNARYAYKAGSSSQAFSASTLNATTVDLGNWTVTESAGVLYFATLGVNKAKLDSSGNFTVVGDVTAYGTI